MKSNFTEISGILLITLIVFIILYMVLGSEGHEINAIVQGENKTEQITDTSDSHPQHAMILINTTDVSNCLSHKPLDHISEIHQKEKTSSSDASTLESDVDSTTSLGPNKN